MPLLYEIPSPAVAANYPELGHFMSIFVDMGRFGMAIGIEMDMDIRKEIVGRGCMIAMPYYGSLIRPQSGLETLYLMAEVNRESGSVEALNVKVWDTVENPDLPEWLKDEGIEAIICEDFQPKLEKSLQDRGVSACWNHEGEMGEAVLRMFNDNGEHSGGGFPDS